MALRYVRRTLPAFAVLFVIHARHTVPWLWRGHNAPDLGYSAEASVVLQLLQVACLLYLFAAYVMALREHRDAPGTRRTVMRTAALLTLAAVTLVPANSSDILDYIGFGRLFALNGLNPYTHTYGELSDWFATYVTWDAPMPYGPLLLPLFGGAGWLAEWHLPVGIYALKLAWGALHLLNASMVYAIAETLELDAAWACFAFACNPLILLELPGNGHNDALMLACVIGSWLALRRHRGALALILAMVGAVTKTPALIWVGATMVLLARERQWRSLSIGVSACAAIALGVALIPGAANALTVGNSQWHFGEDSLHTIVILAGTTAVKARGWDWTYDTVFAIDRVLSSVLFATAAGWVLSRIRSVPDLIRRGGIVMLALLLLYAPAVEPWYFAWVLPVAALTTDDRQRRVIVMAMISSLALYAFPFWLVEQSPHHAAWTAIRLLVAFTPPIVTWGVHSRRAWGASVLQWNRQSRAPSRPVVGNW